MKYDDYIIIAKRKDGTILTAEVSSDTPRKDFKEIYRHGSIEEIMYVFPKSQAV